MFLRVRTTSNSDVLLNSEEISSVQRGSYPTRAVVNMCNGHTWYLETDYETLLRELAP